MKLQGNYLVRVVRPLSTYHPVGSVATVLRVSERGDFTLSTNDEATPEMSYGFAYRPCVEVIGMRCGDEVGGGRVAVVASSFRR